MSEEKDTLALVPIEDIKRRSQYLELVKKQLLAPSDYQHFKDKKTGQDRQFLKKSAFRQIAAAFNISDRVARQERTDRDDGSFVWRIVVEAAFPDGRISSGVGACDSREHPKSTQIEHDIYSIAHTRAKNRAISDLVAGGVLSAEEMEAPAAVTETDDDIEPAGDVGLEGELAVANLDPDLLEFSTFGNTFTVKPKQRMEGSLWNEYHAFLKGKGFKYNPQSKAWERGE